MAGTRAARVGSNGLKSELGAYMSKDEATQCIVGTRKGVAVARARVRGEPGAVRIEPAAAGNDDRRILVGNIVHANLQAYALVEIEHRRQVDVVVCGNVGGWW